MGQSVRMEMLKTDLTMNRSSELKPLLLLVKLLFFFFLVIKRIIILQQYPGTELDCINIAPLYHTYIGKSPLE